MAIKTFCDICSKEITDTKFRSELIISYIREVLLKDQTRPQVVEKHYQFCQKCLTDKLPGFDA